MARAAEFADISFFLCFFLPAIEPQMVMPIGQYGPPNDLFYAAPWNYTQTVAGCQANFGVTPRPTWVTQQFGGPQDWKDATNIVFSKYVSRATFEQT